MIPKFSADEDYGDIENERGKETDILGFGLIVLNMLTVKCTDIPNEIYNLDNYLQRSKEGGDGLKILEKLKNSLIKLKDDNLRLLIE